MRILFVSIVTASGLFASSAFGQVMTGSGIDTATSNQRLENNFTLFTKTQGDRDGIQETDIADLKKDVENLQKDSFQLRQIIEQQQKAIEALATYDPETLKTVRSESVSQRVYAYCPSNTTLVAGGCSSIAGAVLNSRPSFPNPTYKSETYNGWNCTFQAEGYGAAYAICREQPQQ